MRPRFLKGLIVFALAAATYAGLHAASVPRFGPQGHMQHSTCGNHNAAKQAIQQP